jgi:hypothetical protein
LQQQRSNHPEGVTSAFGATFCRHTDQQGLGRAGGQHGLGLLEE